MLKALNDYAKQLRLPIQVVLREDPTLKLMVYVMVWADGAEEEFISQRAEDIACHLDVIQLKLGPGWHWNGSKP